MPRQFLSPLTKKRWSRFRRLPHAWWSLVALVALYILSGAAELLCNSKPLLLRHDGRWYFPLVEYVSEKELLANGRDVRADFIALNRQGVFQDSFVLWAPLRNDPYRIVPPEELTPVLDDQVTITPELRVAGITVDSQLRIQRATGLHTFLPPGAPEENLTRQPLEKYWVLPPELSTQLQPFFRGEEAAEVDLQLSPQPSSPYPAVRLKIAASAPRPQSRRVLRARLLETSQSQPQSQKWSFRPGENLPKESPLPWQELPEDLRQKIHQSRSTLDQNHNSVSFDYPLNGRQCNVTLQRQVVRYPFPPTAGHLMGLDDAGRDVLARIIYGLRIALNFGFILVICSLSVGTFFGILQGYAGGTTDIIGQRLIEIWSGLPFLYVMILMGSIYGPGFMLLLFCYAIFNWVGISYYVRAETLRLRNQPFVEAARCMGLSPWRIAWKHILPNALVPLITFFPFSLVGAIGSLAALDYLGFGLPPPSPSLGELLAQAQTNRWAWWLVLFPALTLFLVMLIGVMIGEGLRNAYDPRRQNRLQ